ncbi:hypothetical protein B0H11DRAFT_309073 [Mycena galericulata]|nr:hypothetical protein B0H11DRAFT_309073 [Mycena galericulata]
MRDVVVLLFKELAGARSLPEPSEAALRFVVKVLAQADDASPWAFVILCKARDWFRDHEQWRILREYPVWAFMGRIALTNPQVLGPEYLEMANTLSEIPEWASDIRNDPTSWFMIQHHTDWRPWQYTNVLKRLWDTTNAAQTYRFKEFAEEALARTLIALTNIWGIFDDSAYSIFLQREDSTEEFIRLVTCTVEIAFRPTYTFMSSARPISPLFRMTFLLPLGNTLMKAAVIAKRAPGFRQMDRTFSWERPAALLHEMGSRLAGDHAPPPGSAKEDYWLGLQSYFRGKMDKKAIWLPPPNRSSQLRSSAPRGGDNDEDDEGNRERAAEYSGSQLRSASRGQEYDVENEDGDNDGGKHGGGSKSREHHGEEASGTKGLGASEKGGKLASGDEGDNSASENHSENEREG